VLWKRDHPLRWSLRIASGLLVGVLVCTTNHNARSLIAACLGVIMVILLFDAGANLIDEYWTRPNRRKQGRCSHCGYDLNSLPLEVSLNCPECGRLRM